MFSKSGIWRWRWAYLHAWAARIQLAGPRKRALGRPSGQLVFGLKSGASGVTFDYVIRSAWSDLPSTSFFLLGAATCPSSIVVASSVPRSAVWPRCPRVPRSLRRKEKDPGKEKGRRPAADGKQRSAGLAVSHLAARPDHDNDDSVDWAGIGFVQLCVLRPYQRKQTRGGTANRQAVPQYQSQGLPLRADGPDAWHGIQVSDGQGRARAALPHNARQGDGHHPMGLGRRRGHRRACDRHQHHRRQTGALVRAHRRRSGL